MGRLLHIWNFLLDLDLLFGKWFDCIIPGGGERSWECESSRASFFRSCSACSQGMLGLFFERSALHLAIFQCALLPLFGSHFL